MRPSHKIFLLFVLLMFVSCTDESKEQPVEKEQVAPKPFLQLIASSESGVTFRNTVAETGALNYLKYESIYNGAGVAIGDINNDGLADIYFAGNSSEDKLYLNKGDFKFEDISTSSGIGAHATGWSTGVNMTDVNNDGFLDIYVCRAGIYSNENLRRNKLFINNQDGTFTEKAKAYNLDSPDQSRQTAFFDYDLDGDLDLYLMNEPPLGFKADDFYEYVDKIKKKQLQTDYFFENIDGRFVDKTKEAGLVNFGFGHSIAIGDINKDGYPDLHITHDYDDPDMLFVNNKNKSFSNKTNKVFKHISWSSMGNDLADINNDGLLDLFVLEMAPDDHISSKVNMKAMAPEKFFALAENDQQYQYMFNTLQLNHGENVFSEIAQLTGLAKTDWSWAPLFFDIDLDGKKDLFITNGIKRNFLYRDLKTKIKLKSNVLGRSIKMNELHELVPSTITSNLVYSNEGNIVFNKNQKWIDKANFNSNGAALGDLDNDGDLDLVTNNMEAVAGIYRNSATDNRANNYLKLKFKGTQGNPFALGTKVSFTLNDEKHIQELQNVRGYLSSMNYELVFGTGSEEQIKNVTITWPNNKITKIASLQTNKTHIIDYATVEVKEPSTDASSNTLLSPLNPESVGLSFNHSENTFDDYKEQILLPHTQSQSGPFIATGDVNNDGLEDLFISGARNQSSVLFIQLENNTFKKQVSTTWQQDAKFEDLGSLFFDADNDGDLDLYVTSGGASLPENHPDYQDRLYLNDGKGNFTRDISALAQNYTSTQVVKASDIDNDGDLDLFVGGRIIPNKYPYAPPSMILFNTNGTFENKTATLAPHFSSLGLITGAEFFDADNDGDHDLITLGEWSNIQIHTNDKGTFKLDERSDLEGLLGLWTSLNPLDINNDGHLDFVAGNLGLNSKFKANKKKQFHVFCDDFDGNGTYDVVLSNNYKGSLVPVRGRECSSEQMPFIKEKFQTFQSFAQADIETIYGQENLANALHYKADILESIGLINDGKGNFTIQKLPLGAQLSPIMSVISVDMNKDGKNELIYTGNLFNVEVETVRYDSGIGGVLEFNNNEFSSIPFTSSGFNAIKDARQVVTINDIILVANNNGRLDAFQIN